MEGTKSLNSKWGCLNLTSTEGGEIKVSISCYFGVITLLCDHMWKMSQGRKEAAGGGAEEKLCSLARTSSAHTCAGQGHLEAPREQHKVWQRGDLIPTPGIILLLCSCEALQIMRP